MVCNDKEVYENFNDFQGHIDEQSIEILTS